MKKKNLVQVQPGWKKPSEKIPVQVPPVTPGPSPVPAPSRRQHVASSPAPAPSKKDELRSAGSVSGQAKVGYQMASAEQTAKKAKLDSGGQVRSTPRSAKPKSLVREDLNEDFWKKLAAEEAQRRRIYPYPVAQSPWKTGTPAAASKFKFTRPPAAAQRNQDPGTSTGGSVITGNGVKTNKRKLYSKTSEGPEEF